MFLRNTESQWSSWRKLQFLQKLKDDYAASTHSARQTDRQMREEGEIVGAKRVCFQGSKYYAIKYFRLNSFHFWWGDGGNTKRLTNVVLSLWDPARPWWWSLHEGPRNNHTAKDKKAIHIHVIKRTAIFQWVLFFFFNFLGFSHYNSAKKLSKICSCTFSQCFLFPASHENCFLVLLLYLYNPDMWKRLWNFWDTRKRKEFFSSPEHSEQRLTTYCTSYMNGKDACMKSPANLKSEFRSRLKWPKSVKYLARYSVFFCLQTSAHFF